MLLPEPGWDVHNHLQTGRFSGARMEGARFFYKQAAPPELGWRGHGSSTNRPLLRSSDGGGTVLLQTGRSSGARMEGARFFYKQAAPPELGWRGARFFYKQA